MSILCFFEGISVKDGSVPSITKQFIQIGTGEGKSVTLAITSCILALLGFDVNCACYSQYLSKRDHESFESLFRAFGLYENITYGTFNALAEEFINSGFKDNGIRGAVTSVIDSKAPRDRNSVIGTIVGMACTVASMFTSSASSIKRLRMLLIDEVDVFFQKEFYGNVYSPLAKVCDSTVSALLCHIYTNRADPKQLSLRNIYNSQAFQACISRFPNWTELLEESVKCMVSDVKTFETHNYQVLRGQISYADQDAMSFNKQFGYKTTFAYFFEMEKGRIDKNTCDEHLYLLVKCGSFSYAEIPNMYHSVLGVSGTLSTLSAAERWLLTEGFGIK